MPFAWPLFTQSRKQNRSCSSMSLPPPPPPLPPQPQPTSMHQLPPTAISRQLPPRPPTGSTSLRRIPRPWLEKKSFDDAERRLYDESPSWSTEASESVLLDLKPMKNPIKSVFESMKWCKGFCWSSDRSYDSLNFSRSDGIIGIIRGRRSNPPLTYSNNTDNQSFLGFGAKKQSKFDHTFTSDSSLILTPRPAIIYVVHEKNSNTTDFKLSPPPPESNVGQNWHQQYLSFFTSFGSNENLNIERKYSENSMNTSMTTLTCDDDLCADSLPTAATISLLELGKSSNSSRRLPTESGIPRPPSNLQRKEKSTQLFYKTCPDASYLSILSRPNALIMPESISTTTGSMCFREGFDVDTDSSLASDSLDYEEFDDDDDDDISTILSAYPGSVKNPKSKKTPLSQERRFRREEKSVYLAKCSLLDFPVPPYSASLLSGWVAYSRGDSLLHKRKILLKHLAYLVVNEDENAIHLKRPSSLSRAKIKAGGGEIELVDESISLPSHTCVKTIDSACGRCVILIASSKMICTILPVHVPTTASGQQEIIKQKKERLVTRSSVAQHDAALNLWFGLDGWLRRRVVNCS